MAIVIILSSFIGFLTGVIDLLLLGGGFWGAVQTYLFVSFALSLALGSAVSLVRLRAPERVATDEETYSRWNEWHAEEDMQTSKIIGEMPKKGAGYNQSA